MSDGPFHAYLAKVAAGDLEPDPIQKLAAHKLQSLHLALAGYRPSMGETGWLGRFGFGAKAGAELAWRPGDAVGDERRQGLYIYGGVGCGKSMLMDMFFADAPLPAKRRVHFHAFMRDIHKSIHAWRSAAHRAKADPIPRLAREIAEDAWLLCLDELEVNDIADALIVGRLFEALMEDGVVVVVTSNRPPGDLYQYGLQRERFLPFIDLIERRLDVLHLDVRHDYRRGRDQGLAVYHTPPGPAAEAALDAAFVALAGDSAVETARIEVTGHELVIGRTARGVARCRFTDLCDAALGPADYLALAERFHTLILSDIPRLSPDDRNQARRFVTLIDALYEAKTLLICSAAAPPDGLFPTGDGAFEFKRTASRLMEMQSSEWGRHP